MSDKCFECGVTYPGWCKMDCSQRRRPDQKAIHNVPAPFTPQRAGNLSRLVLRLVGDWQLTGDRAASVASCVDADGSFMRVNWLACVLPLATHEERVAAAEKLLAECGYTR
jgi:hypothetical protein